MMNSRYRLDLAHLCEVAAAAVDKRPLEAEVQEFNTLLKKQVDLLNHYCPIKYEELLLEIQNVARNIKRVIKLMSNYEPNSSEEDLVKEKELAVILTSSERQLFATGDDIVCLELCIRENFQLLVKAIIHFDSVMKTSAATWFVAQLQREWFANVNCEKLLIALSLCWEKWRILEAKEWKTDVKAWKPPESFVRNTVKYWITPNKVTQCKTSIIRHCPYLIYGFGNDELEYLIDPYDVASAKPATSMEHISDGQLVSSVYFDSVTGYSYNQRVRRMEGAQLVRFRWYGENEEVETKETCGVDAKHKKTVYASDPNLEVFIERKTHHESWSGQDSIKERFSLPQKRVSDYMSNRLNLDQWLAHVCAERKLSPDSKKISGIRKLADEVSVLLEEHQLVPMLRTSYLRSAFQRSDRNDIRFSLDTNLCMVNEYREERSLCTNWCKTENEILGNDEVIRFPYAVLEVKLQTEQPEWVSKMLYDCCGIMVFKFSKFQHGFAFLHRDKIPLNCPLPHWIQDFENRGYVPGFLIPSQKTRSASSLLRYGSIRAVGVPEYKALVYKRGKNVRKYDPKSIFACERTLMHYVHKSIYVSAAGLGAIELRWLTLGSVAIACAIAAMVYSLTVYIQRMNKIVSRLTKESYRERLDDVHAPLVATGLVAAGLLVGLFIQVRQQLSGE